MSAAVAGKVGPGRPLADPQSPLLRGRAAPGGAALEKVRGTPQDSDAGLGKASLQV